MNSKLKSRKFNIYIYIYKIVLTSCFALTIPVYLTSCSTTNKNSDAEFNFEKDNIKVANSYLHWANSLTRTEWNKNTDGTTKDAICSSEQQAMYLYLNQWGDFWNKDLHLQKEPIDTKRKMIPNPDFKENVEYEINGDGYKHIVSALNKTQANFDLQVYHGVEFMEVEFWEQLKDFVTSTDNGYDFSKTVGQKITSYGFISTSMSKETPYGFSTGMDWTDGNKLKPPLKEPALFIINIKKDTKGVAYVSKPIEMMNYHNNEDQVLINKDKTYKIVDWYKDEKNVNIFTVDLLQ